MTDPTPRLPAGTDLAPCAACGTPMQTSARNGDLFLVECPNCYRGVGVGSLDGFTLAGSPSTRALWAEVERLRAEVNELHLVLAAEQGRAEGAPSEGWEYREGMGADPYWRRRVDIGERIGVIVVHHADGAAVWHDIDSQPHTAPTMRAAMHAADAAEAQAAAKEPTL